MTNTVVSVEEGSLKGKISKTSNNFEFYTFKGIPYAKPPVGELRFSVPVPPDPWDGVRDATADCNICSQFDRDTETVIGDEDCLYLNVYTPKLPSSNESLLPVMVFLHGGGFLFGHGTDDSAHGPDYLVQKNMVIVSFNYRLGVLGFLNLDHKDAPGNMGLRDQVQALKWVQKNIENFCGDPKNVTIFGFSAGGASVEYLLLSPMARGLFHKAISHSGSSLLPWAQSNSNKKIAYKIPAIKGKTITDDEELLKYLKELPIKDLVEVSMKAIYSDSYRGGIYFGFVPTIEKPGEWETFLDKKPYDLLSQGNFTKVPFISGVCSREGLLMVSHWPVRLEKLFTDKKFTDFIPFHIDDTEKMSMEAKLKKIYLEGTQKYSDEDAFAIDYFSDTDFFGGGYVSALLISKSNSPVYFYEFAYDGGLNYLKYKNNVNREGACHGDDGGYFIKADVLEGRSISETDKLVRSRLLEMWKNFATYGNPTPKLDSLVTTKWEPIADTGLVYLHIDSHLTMKDETELYPNRAKLFKELYKNYSLYEI